VRRAGSAEGGSGDGGRRRGDAASDAVDAFDDSAVETVAAPEVKRRPRRAHRYQVVMHNDDYTTMEFVVAMLMKHFHKPPAEALHIMLLVHHKGAGIAGVYTRDVAETKVAEVIDEARQEGMPLLLTVEPHGSNDPEDAAGPDGLPGAGGPAGPAGPGGQR
jgi:ATP-dependent Clp protease adaptor protein ClpS